MDNEILVLETEVKLFKNKRRRPIPTRPKPKRVINFRSKKFKKIEDDDNEIHEEKGLKRALMYAKCNEEDFEEVNQSKPKRCQTGFLFKPFSPNTNKNRRHRKERINVMEKSFPNPPKFDDFINVQNFGNRFPKSASSDSISHSRQQFRLVNKRPILTADAKNHRINQFSQLGNSQRELIKKLTVGKPITSNELGEHVRVVSLNTNSQSAKRSFSLFKTRINKGLNVSSSLVRKIKSTPMFDTSIGKEQEETKFSKYKDERTNTIFIQKSTVKESKQKKRYFAWENRNRKDAKPRKIKRIKKEKRPSISGWDAVSEGTELNIDIF